MIALRKPETSLITVSSSLSQGLKDPLRDIDLCDRSTVAQTPLVPQENSLQLALNSTQHSFPKAAGKEKEKHWVKAAVESWDAEDKFIGKVESLLPLHAGDDFHLGKDVWDTDQMVGSEAHTEDDQDHEGLCNGSHTGLLALLLTFPWDTMKLDWYFAIGVKEEQQKNEESSHRYHVEGCPHCTFASEMEALLITGTFISSLKKERDHEDAIDQPNQPGDSGTARHSVDSELLEGPNDLQVAVKADKAEEHDADVHIEVKESSN